MTTRESVPRFDLYGELEVSASASAETIEAAYRSLVKRFHPDVLASVSPAETHPEERIKRINVAREWLTDPERRRRYDSAQRRRDARPRTADTGATDRADSGSSATGAGWTTTAPSSTAGASGFGVNTAAVRAFLAEIRQLDETRALQVRDGKASIDPDDYAHAKRAAFAISRVHRLSEWLFARDAAMEIVRGQLGENLLGREIGEILSDVAGALAARDLLPAVVFDTLREPWAWQGKPLPAKTPRPVVISTPPPPPGPTLGRPTSTAPKSEPRSTSQPARPSFLDRLMHPTPARPAEAARSTERPAPTPTPAAATAAAVTPTSPSPMSSTATSPTRPPFRPTVVASAPIIEKPRPEPVAPKPAPMPAAHPPSPAPVAADPRQAARPTPNPAPRPAPALATPPTVLFTTPPPPIVSPKLEPLPPLTKAVPSTSTAASRVASPSNPSPKPGTSGGQLLPPLDLGQYRRAAIGVSTVSLVALIGLATLVGSGFLGGHQFTGGVAGIQATQPAASVPAVAVATPTPVTPTPAPTPGTDANGFTAAQLAALQQHAWTTVQQLRTDARNGNVVAAQKLLGNSGRGLTVSGLVHATFPDVDPTAISIAKAATGTGYVGTIGSDQLTSRDGTHWTFNYGERPLERFGSTLEHDLFWREPRGQHDIEITITAVTIHRSGVDVHLAWRYGPDPRYGDDGHYYAGDQLQIASITAAGVNLGGARAGALEATAAATTVTVPAQLTAVSRMTIVVEIVNEQTGAAARAFSTISTTFSVR